MPNYSFVIDSSFRPFSFQELLAPLALYKEEYEKTENAYDELAKSSGIFSYLEKRLEDNPDSAAAQIYSNYMNDLKKQAKDLEENGLNINNKKALHNLRRRYSSEIGQLENATKELDELRKQRNALSSAGKVMLYANDNPTIDDMLENSQFNRYSIDTKDLRDMGASIGKSISSREYSAGDVGSTLRDYYRVWKETKGVSPERIAEFVNSDMVQGLVNNAMIANGVADNLKGRNLELARRNILQGIYDNILYEESYQPVRDPGVMSAAEAASNERANRQQAISEAMNGIKVVNGVPVYDKNSDLSLQRQLEVIQEKAKATAEAKAANGGGGGSSSEYGAINQQGVRVQWNGDNPNNTNEEADDDADFAPLDKEEAYVGNPYDYDDLPDYAKNKVDRIIGNKGNYDNYVYYFRPYKSGFWGDTEAAIDIVPRRVMKDNTEEFEFDFGSN